MTEMKFYKIFILQSVLAALVFGGCGIDPEYYSEVAPATFYDSPERVYQRLASVYLHWSANEGPRFNGSSWSLLQEMPTDEICFPVRATDWLDGGIWLRSQFHDFTPTTYPVEGGWNGVGTGVARAWDAKKDLLLYVDWETMFPGDPAGTRTSMMMQIDVLVASFYLRGLDFFGGMPIYRSNKEPVKARASAKEVFNFIDSLLTQENISKLPLKTDLNAYQNGSVDQGCAAALLARLYFNAEAYIGEKRYAECAQICEDFIAGKYGTYALADDFRKIFGWGNETCGEIIWTVPSDNVMRKVDGGNYAHGLHYNAKKTLGNLEMEAFNGWCMRPSLDGDGRSYIEGRPNASPKASKLGSPFAKFEDTDLRKQQYKYEGDGKYHGMFLFGVQENCDPEREYKDDKYKIGETENREPIYQPIELVDQIAYMTRHGTDEFKEGISYAEENSGVRLMKFSPIPTSTDKSLWYNPDMPVLRLTEIHYMLAECKLQQNTDLAGAAQLINNVRKRYFEGENDPNPVTAANLDKYRMLDEWLIEFIGENRRRTDLVRWGEFTMGRWFDHEPDGPGKEHYNRFPIPQEAVGANPLLEQETGYK
ncbi:MAG: RagB/SusD family nutrient uptake outer membrane protein [Bacteroidales bacterium]|jgi:hypothetical protein|nr:RagB/SusD family nutrient uptake outer membrane protein [Bacteroidales bacterium]